MTNVFELILNFNIHISVLLIGIITLRWLLKKVFKIYNVYWLWALLPLVPVLAAISTYIPETQQAVIIEQISLAQSEISPMLTDVAPESLLNYKVENTTKAIIHHSNSIEFMPIATVIWLLVCLFLISRLLQQHRSLRIQLENAKVEISTEFKKRYPVVGIDIDGFSPAVYGFFNPKIYFPKALISQLNADQRSLILEHEEQHIRQGHLWLNLVWDTVVCLNWFNPLLYIARYLYRHDQEVLCDSLVLKNHDEPRQKAYGHALLSTVSATHSVSLLCSWKMFDQLEERIMNIKSKYKKTKLIVLLTAIISVLSITSLYAIASGTEEPSDNKAMTVKGELIAIDIARPHAQVKEALRAGEEVSSIGVLGMYFDDQKEIVIKLDGKMYQEKGGEQFVIENGMRRDLYNEERAEMQDLIKKAELYRDSPTANNLNEIFNTDNVLPMSTYSDNYQMDILREYFENIQNVYDTHVNFEERRLKTNSVFSSESYTERFINLVLHDARTAENQDDPEVIMAIESLEQAKKELIEIEVSAEKRRMAALQKIENLQKVYEPSKSESTDP